MSRPRAATSVATRTFTLSFLKSSKTLVLAFWFLLPWIASALTPEVVSALASLSAPCLVRLKISVFENSSCIKRSLSTSNLVLPWMRMTSWSMFLAVSLVLTEIRAGVFKNSCINFSISADNVAEKNLTWSLCSHDHGCATRQGFEKKGRWFSAIVKYARDLGIRFLSVSRYYEEMVKCRCK